MLKGVIFDVDGVIVNSHPTHKKAWAKFLSSAGKKVSEDELEFVLDGRKKEDILRHFLGDLSAEQVREYGQLKELIFREEASAIGLIEGCYEFISSLHKAGISLAVASSGSNGRVRHILEQHQLRHCFQAIITGDDVSTGKPDPTIFRRAAEGLRHDPKDLLVIEDAVSGVVAAKSMGMKCIGVAQDHRGQLLRDAGADLVIPSFAGLPMTRLHALFA